MYFANNKLYFKNYDMHFVQKFGFMESTKIALEHYRTHKFPYIYDTYQLAGVLGVSCKGLFKMLRNADHNYRTICLKKKNGGVRTLHEPYPSLKRLQTAIFRYILSNYPISPYATAYFKGSCIQNNAAPHVNHKYLLKMDITDFFGSITYLQVLSCAFSSKIFPPHIGAMLTSLCCKNDVLPQGAPTSPILSNLIMKQFDDILGDWCAKRNVTYTRYCDDLTFSSDKPLQFVYNKASAMLEKWGFRINEKKTHFITNANRQTVTGLTVNEKITVPKDYKRQLRQELHYAIKFGLADAIIKGDRERFVDAQGEPMVASYYHHLLGRVLYVLQIEPHNTWFIKAKDNLNHLQLSI